VFRRKRFDAAAAVVVAVVVGAACTGGGGKRHAAPPTTRPAIAVTPTRSIKVQPALLAGADAKTAAPPVEISIRPSTDGTLAVTFDEHDVGPTRSLWEAAGWNAAIVASLITGAPIADRELHFRVAGRLTAQNAGALLTIAVIALLRGDELEPDITITGMVNPDGTIGPVPGVPESVAAAVRARKARMLVPFGERTVADASGKIVDVVATGPQLGIRVAETPDVYNAYQLFTGKALPQPPASTKTALNPDAYDALDAKVDTWSARFVSARNAFRALAPTVQQDLNPYAAAAQRQQHQARKLADAGKRAGAFTAAVNAAGLMRAAALAGTALPTLLTQGVAPFVSAVKTAAPVERALANVGKALDDVTPVTVTEAGALTAAYGNLVDAASLSKFAQRLFAATDLAGQPDLAQVLVGAIYTGLAGSLVEAANDLITVSHDLGGPDLPDDIDATPAADALHRAAQANLAAFQSEVVAPRARAAHAGTAAMSDAIARADTVYALARTGDRTLAGLSDVLGVGSPSGYAGLGGALGLYVRSALLNAKYSSLGVVDTATLVLVRPTNPGAFASVLERAQSRLAANLAMLRARHVNPTIVAADYEIGSDDQKGPVTDKFDALGDYWDGYVNSRVLASLGGLAPSR